MPNIQSSQVRGYLQNVSVRFAPKGLIAEDAFPQIPNVTAKAKLLSYRKGDQFRDEAGVRGGKGRMPRGDYRTSDINIDPIEYGFAKEVRDKDRKIQKQMGSPPMKLDQEAVEYTSQKRMLNRERRAASEVLTVGEWSGQAVGGEDAAGLWAPSGSNTFIEDVTTRIATIFNATGIMPNRLIMDLTTWLGLTRESTLVDRLKITSDKIVTEDLVAKLFRLDRVHIAGAVYSSATKKKDGTDFTSVNIWEVTATKGSAFLYYATPRPGLREPNAMYFCRENFDNGGIISTRTWREEAEAQTVYESAEQSDFVITSNSLGFLWKDTHTT